MSFIRWKALLPLAVLLVLLVGGAMLFANPITRRGVEVGGTAAVGAKVDLAKARVGLLAGNVTFSGLAVTDPSKPMTNLFEAEEIVFDVGILPALEGKIVIDTMAARGLRFGTARKTSGAIARDPDAADGEPSAVRKIVDDWVSQVKVPPLSLSTLTQTVNVDAISAESLATLRAARAVGSFADTARDRFTSGIRALDPRPTIDSAEALANRLRNANLRTLGIAGARQAATDVRRTIRELDALNDKLKAFEKSTKADVDSLGGRVEAIGRARATDYAYARGLLRLPTFEIPAIGPQLFSGLIAEKVGEVMYWVNMAEAYIPSGLERQMQKGPDRVRASGTTVLFPKEKVYPDFLTRLAELSLAIGGEGASAGEYEARVVGVTTQPAVYGAPTRFIVNRAAGKVGPREARISGSLDHRSKPVRDSLTAVLTGFPLPTMPLAGLGAAVDLGDGTSELQLARDGDRLGGRWLWRSNAVKWARDTTSQPRANTPTMRLVEDALWRAVSRIEAVEIEARFSGSVTKPELAVRTNIAEAVANALKDQLGEEVRRAEQQVRAKVDALVDEKAREARTKADQVKQQAETRIAEERSKLEAQKAALEARLKELVRIPGIG
jgi:uncharacterized protein (TIGR03545 family)